MKKHFILLENKLLVKDVLFSREPCNTLKELELNIISGNFREESVEVERVYYLTTNEFEVIQKDFSCITTNDHRISLIYCPNKCLVIISGNKVGLLDTSDNIRLTEFIENI